MIMTAEQLAALARRVDAANRLSEQEARTQGRR